MKFLCELERNARLSAAKWKEYKNVGFGDNFTRFLSALQIEKIYEDAKPLSTDGGYVWSNGIGDGRLYLFTSNHPLISHGIVETLKVGGSACNMTLFENILTRYAKAGEEEEVKPEEVALDFPYHEKLNPALWRSIDEGEYELKPEVKEKLLDIADTFFRTLKTPALEINDIVLTGSNANYNWTEHSDIDLHIIVNVVTGAKKYGKIFPDYITAKRHLWNDRHVVKVHGYAVEVYVQDEREPHSSSGMYSLKNDEWSHVPKHVEPHYDDYAVRTKTAEYMNMINELTDKDGKECNSKRAEEVMEKLKTYRTAGLSTAGEFSVENLVFKVLRNKGYISKLAKCRTQGLDTKLSTEDEEWWNK